MYEKHIPFYDGYKQEMWEAARKLPQMVTELNRSCKREGRYVEYDKKLKNGLVEPPVIHCITVTKLASALQSHLLTM